MSQAWTLTPRPAARDVGGHGLQRLQAARLDQPAPSLVAELLQAQASVEAELAEPFAVSGRRRRKPGRKAVEARRGRSPKPRPRERGGRGAEEGPRSGGRSRRRRPTPPRAGAPPADGRAREGSEPGGPRRRRTARGAERLEPGPRGTRPAPLSAFGYRPQSFRGAVPASRPLAALTTRPRGPTELRPASHPRIHKAFAGALISAVPGASRPGALLGRADRLVRHICDPPRRRPTRMRELAWAVSS